MSSGGHWGTGDVYRVVRADESGVRLIVRYPEFQTFDHLIVLSVERDQGERTFDGRRRYQGIEDVESVRFCIGLQQAVGCRSDGLAEGHNKVRQRQQEPVNRRNGGDD